MMPLFFEVQKRSKWSILFSLILLLSSKNNVFIVNSAIDMNGPPDRVYYYPIGYNLASVYIGPGVGNFLSIDTQVTNFVSPCQFMHPITIQFIGSYPKSGMTPIKKIICDSVSLQKSLENFKLGQDTVKVVKACTDIAQVLMESKTTYTIFNGANNITIWLEGSKLVNIVREFNEQLPNKIPKIMDRDVRYQFDPTIFGNDVMDKVGISEYLFKATAFPFKISVDYSEVMPGINSHGTNIPVIEFSTNISLSYEYSQQNSQLSSFWTPPTGFGGFFPMLIPNDKFANGVLYTTYTEPGKHAGFVAWGSLNTPITSPFIRLVPPSRIPESDIDCTSNYDFYYPTLEAPKGEVGIYPKNLEVILRKDSSEKYRNTVSVQSYWNKIPFGANWYENGFPVGSPNSQWIETGNYYGGCYYNGTFPLVPSSSNNGFKNTICSTQSVTISDHYKTAFYPPPLEFLQYGVSNMQSMITAILQYGVERSSNLNSVFDYNSNVEFLGPYSSFHIFGATPGLQLTSPSPRLNVPFVQYSGRDLIAGDPFFNFNFQYMQDRFGHCSEPNGCWICSNPRVIPWKTEKIDQMNFTEFCASNITVIPNSRMIAFKFYYGDNEEDLEAQTASGFQSCVKSVKSRWTPVGLNTTEFTFKAGEYHTNTMFIYNTLSNDTCCSPMNTYFYFQHYYTIVTEVFQPIQLTQITPFTDPYAGGILPGIFMNRDFSYQFYIDVYPDSTWTKSSRLLLSSWLICPELESIDLEATPENVLLGDIIDAGGKVGGSIRIPPFILPKFFGTPTYCILRAFIFVSEEVKKKNIKTLKAVKFNEYEQENPRIYRSEEGMHEYAQWIFVNNGFLSLGSDIIEPNPGKTTISDALYIPMNVTHHYNFTITPFLFSAVALDSPIFTPGSQIFELVLSGQHNRFGLRLPPTHSKWYIFTRTADKWDQGCFVRCEGDMSRSPYVDWCLPKMENNPFTYNLCNYTVVTTSSEISESQIEDAIAVVTNPISYLSYVDTMSLVNALFSFPTTSGLIWDKYFEKIYDTAIRFQSISYNQDYPFAQPTTLAAINRILNKYYYREKFDILTSLPLESIQRIYTLVECFLVNGLDNLVLNTTDLIGVTNPLPQISPENLKVLFSIYQGVASRKSYTHGVYSNYALTTEKTHNTVYSSTFNQVDMLKGVSVGGISFPSINVKEISTDNILFHDGVYYKVNPKLYKNNKAIEGFNSCSKSFNTITVVKTGNYVSNYLIIKNLENIEDYPLALSTFVFCTLEYEIWNIENRVKFSFFAEYTEELDYSEVYCTAMKQDHSSLSPELCSTERIKHFTNQTIEFKCSCSAITYYGLTGKPTQFIPSLINNDLSLLFSSSNPNILQPFMLVSNPTLTSSCAEYLPINILLKNIPTFVSDESIYLNFKCILPEAAYSSLEFCRSIEEHLQTAEFSFSRLGQEINITYFANPSIILDTALPTLNRFWRPENKESTFSSIGEYTGLTVFLNITFDINSLGFGNNLPDIFGVSLFDIVIPSESNSQQLASELGEIFTIYPRTRFINIPGAFTKSRIPVSSISHLNIPYSVPYNSPEYCSEFLKNYFSGNNLRSITLGMGHGAAIRKNTHFIPELIEKVGMCEKSITYEEYNNGESVECLNSNSYEVSSLNTLQQPITLLTIKKSSSFNTNIFSKENLIIHNETIEPSVNAFFPEIVSRNYPRISFEIDNSKTIEQIVSQKGYCDSLITGCSSCRASRSYQADFQFKDHEIKYYCSATSNEDQINSVRTGLLAACRSDGSYWGQACSFQQSNTTISGNVTYTEFGLIPQDHLTHFIFSIGIKSNGINSIECKDFVVSMTEMESPFQIIPLRIPKVVSQATETFILSKIKYIGRNDWDDLQGYKFLAFAYFESTGYFWLKTNPENYYSMKRISKLQNKTVSISIQLNITRVEVNPRENKLSVILLVLKDGSNVNISENRLNLVVKRNNIQNLVSSGDFVSYVWRDISFEQDYSLIKIKSGTNIGTNQIIPLYFKITNYDGIKRWKFSLLATVIYDEVLNQGLYEEIGSNATLLSYLSPEIPQFIRLPTSFESWKVHLVIHNGENELLCGVDCSKIGIQKIDKHMKEMFCVDEIRTVCKFITFERTKNVQGSASDIFRLENELKSEYSALIDYFIEKQNIGDLSDKLMIGSILSTKLKYLTKKQISDFGRALFELTPDNKDLTGGNSIMIIYSLLKIFEFTPISKTQKSNDFWNSNKFLKLALKAECGYNVNYPTLVSDILDHFISMDVLENAEVNLNSLGALSINQWVMSNTLGSRIELSGTKSRFFVISSVVSEQDLENGIQVGSDLFIPKIDFTDSINQIDILLIKNIYFQLYYAKVNFDEGWGRSLLSNCHDPRFGFTLIKPSLELYIKELTAKIQKDVDLNGVFQKVYDGFMSRCGYEYRLFGTKSKVVFIVGPEFTPSIVLGKLLRYQCAIKKKDGSWTQDNCETNYERGRTVCSCNSLGEYGLKTTYQASLSEVTLTLSHNPGSIQEVNINNVIYKINNGKFYYKNQVFDIISDEMITINPDNVFIGRRQIPLVDYTNYDSVTKLTLRQEGVLGIISLKSKELNIDIEGSNVIHNGFTQGNYIQNSTMVIV
ncbi:Secreted GGC family protein [Cryptosporidium felis]|nr:Secreted GGC family protein [Cryptosporidium felis]